MNRALSLIFSSGAEFRDGGNADAGMYDFEGWLSASCVDCFPELGIAEFRSDFFDECEEDRRLLYGEDEWE
jgi:hypothetical protein